MEEMDELFDSLTEGTNKHRTAVLTGRDIEPQIRTYLYNEKDELVNFEILVAPLERNVDSLLAAMKTDHPEIDLIFFTDEDESCMGMEVVHPEKVKGVEVFVFTDLVEYYYWSA